MPNTATDPPVETKVTWATSTAGFIAFIITGIADAARDTDSGLLFPAMPDWLEPIIIGALTALPTFLAGYSARHTHRPDLRGDTPIP